MGEASRTRIAILSPYASTRAGLSSFLDEEFEVIAAVSDPVELAALGDLPQVIVADTDGLADLLGTLRGGDTGLVALVSGPRQVAALSGAGLPGWAHLSRDADRDEIIAAVHAVAAGLIVLDQAPESEPVWHPFEGATDLTSRELEVLQLMAHGLQNKQIADRLTISLHTVKFHVASILAKLGAGSRTEAVTLGVRRGYVAL